MSNFICSKCRLRTDGSPSTDDGKCWGCAGVPKPSYDSPEPAKYSEFVKANWVWPTGKLLGNIVTGDQDKSDCALTTAITGGAEVCARVASVLLESLFPKKVSNLGWPAPSDCYIPSETAKGSHGELARYMPPAKDVTREPLDGRGLNNIFLTDYATNLHTECKPGMFYLQTHMLDKRTEGVRYVTYGELCSLKNRFPAVEPYHVVIEEDDVYVGGTHERFITTSWKRTLTSYYAVPPEDSLKNWSQKPKLSYQDTAEEKFSIADFLWTMRKDAKPLADLLAFKEAKEETDEYFSAMAADAATELSDVLYEANKAIADSLASDLKHGTY